MRALLSDDPRGQLHREFGAGTSSCTPVTLHIACDRDSGVLIVRLEGWLEGEAIAELDQVVGGSAEPLRLDLSELRSADAAGLEALRALRAKGASLVGASPYIGLLLGT